MYELSKKGKHVCPSCGQRTFVLYVSSDTGQPLHSTVGRCDRQDKCAHHYPPKEFFADNGICHDRDSRQAPHLPPKPKPQPSFIDEAVFKRTLMGYNENIFVQWLISIVGEDSAMAAVLRYNIGTSRDACAIFWQQDQQGRVRAGKIIPFGSDGHRRKDVKQQVQWVHTALKLPDYNLQQCLFGEHLLMGNTLPVAVVESEKTAILASVYIPDMVWLACGGSEGLSMDKCAVLKGRKVILFPDAGQHTKWREKAKELSQFCTTVVSDMVEMAATDEEREAGFDLADYLIRFKVKDFAHQKEKQPEQNAPDPSTPQLPDSDMPEFTAPQILSPQQCLSQNKPRPNPWDDNIAALEAFYGSVSIPNCPVQLGPGVKIVDASKFISSHMEIIKEYNGNFRFLPYLNRLQTLSGILRPA